jgi:hypothetical protein
LTTHHDALPHVPPALQNPPQHSAFAPHGLPEVLQVVLSGVHVPPLPHSPLQH